MREFLVAMATMALILTRSASAETFTEWSFEGSTNKSGEPFCTVYASPLHTAGQKMLAIQKFRSENLLHVRLYKGTWNIPAGKKGVVNFDFQNGNALTFPSVASGKFVDVTIPWGASSAFMARLRESGYMDISFPQGSEESWRARLLGAAPYLVALNKCAMQQRLDNPNPQPF